MIPLPIPPSVQGHYLSFPPCFSSGVAPILPTTPPPQPTRQNLRPWIGRGPKVIPGPAPSIQERAGPGGATYLSGSDWSLADAPVDRVPRAGGQHAGKQGVEITSSQALAVLLHPLHVSPDQRLPEVAVIQAELFREHLRGGSRHHI